MSSIIPGFEFDIFFSYRQKDNKYEGWVNEFIDKLKREIDGWYTYLIPFHEQTSMV